METVKQAFEFSYSYTDTAIFVLYCFIVGTVIIKSIFAATQIALFVVSIMLLSNNQNTKQQNELFFSMASVALIALLVMILAGFNNLILLAGELVLIRYWLVSKWDTIKGIVLEEIQNHILPLLHGKSN